LENKSSQYRRRISTVTDLTAIYGCTYKNLQMELVCTRYVAHDIL